MNTEPRGIAPTRGEGGREVTQGCGPWFRCHWDEEDTWFYFEVDSDGWVVRQVELQGPGLRPLAAARDTDDDARYGFTAESPVSQWEGHAPQPLTAAEFERVWDRARRELSPARPGPT
ncbi:hypothetical protein [Streptomyces sp. NPDC091259]|uniref:hypothetical protein n=1 Tax=Streptomyces sp. NPDC091259 TaxID=3365976 RepID=UPI0038161949